MILKNKLAIISRLIFLIILLIMITYSARKSNSTGLYPQWCGKEDKNHTKRVMYGNTELLFMSLSPHQTATGSGKINRELQNDIFQCLERLESKFYFLSEKFKQLTTEQKENSKFVTVEHPIPVQVFGKLIKDKIFNRDIISAAELLDFIRDNYHVCLISKLEDNLLGGNLKSDIPKEWWKDKSNWNTNILKNPFAKYDKVGVKIIS